MTYLFPMNLDLALQWLCPIAFKVYHRIPTANAVLSVSEFVMCYPIHTSSGFKEHLLIGQFCILCSMASAVTVQSTIPLAEGAD
jgi:hypothetical protein